MAQVTPALRLCKHQISILSLLSPLTLSSSINIFFAYRILQTRLMILYTLHSPNFNSKLGVLLRGATCIRHLYGATITAHQQFSRCIFEHCAVYLRFSHIPHHQRLFHIGSTADNTMERERSRFRKFKQVHEGQFVLSELAIRYWSHCKSFFLWAPVPIYIRRERHWALEHAPIQLWQPKLNFPFVSQFFTQFPLFIRKRPFSNSRQFGIKSLWRKKRWKHTGQNFKQLLDSPLFLNRVRIWSLLQDLGSNTRRRYEQTQFMRSLNFSLQGCYALRRLGPHLPETHQRLALQAIDGAIAFRKGKSIGRVRPFRPPWMLTHRLDSHIRQLLLTWYFGVKTAAVTFHEPSFKVVYLKHPSLMEAICNHKDAIQNWSDDIKPVCKCELLQKYPTARATPNLGSDHWVLDGALLGPLLPGALGQLVGGSLNNKIFPNKKNLKKLFIEAFQIWCKQNAIPLPPEKWILQHFEPLWQDHAQRISNHLTAATIKTLQEQFPDCVFHNEDKRASSLRIFWPCQYFQCIDKTFSDTAIFTRSHESPEECLTVTIQHLRNKFEKSYPWAMGKGQSLPSGYILAKGKKNYFSGRPIIGFFSAPFKPMLSTLAKLLFQLIPRACPNHFARGDVYQLLKLLRNYATTMTDNPLRVYNQDLAGFFISIDTDRFLQSWQLLLRFLAPHMSTGNDEYFSISPVKQNNPGDIIKGRTFRTLNVNRHLRIGTSPR